MRHSCSSSQTSLHYNLTNNRLCLFIKLLISLKIASSKLKIHFKKNRARQKEVVYDFCIVEKVFGNCSQVHKFDEQTSTLYKRAMRQRL